MLIVGNIVLPGLFGHILTLLDIFTYIYRHVATIARAIRTKYGQNNGIVRIN